MIDPEYFEFHKSFQDFVVKDVEKALKGDVEVGTIILTVIGIECLSGYYEGKNSNGETFKSFVQAFMPSYAAYAEKIYACIRNGLAHDYIIKECGGTSFLFTRDEGENHLVPVAGKPGWTYINRKRFASDFLEAQAKYFDQVVADAELYKRAIKRIRKRSFLRVFPEKDLTPVPGLVESPTEPSSMATGTLQHKETEFIDAASLPTRIHPVTIKPEADKTDGG
jgi:hypothetical protein